MANKLIWWKCIAEDDESSDRNRGSPPILGNQLSVFKLIVRFVYLDKNVGSLSIFINIAWFSRTSDKMAVLFWPRSINSRWFSITRAWEDWNCRWCCSTWKSIRQIQQSIKSMSTFRRGPVNLMIVLSEILININIFLIPKMIIKIWSIYGHVIALSSKQLAYNWNDAGSTPAMPTIFNANIS